tara:strand:+ start:10162 stop:11112 length:951 start_codon:yes stop_codon:yes gene_type:complete
VCRVLITGAGGFLGSSLADFLLRETDYKIISLNKPGRSSRLYRNDRVKVIHHDLKKPMGIRCLQEIGEVDYIIHFAASTNVKKSIEEPADFVMNNILGTVNLLEYARENVKNLKQFLYFSTAEVFGRGAPGMIFKEDNAPLSYSPYAATKIGAQELCLSYKNTFNMPVVITYAMNTYGPYQSQDKFIPLIVRKILREEKVFIHLNTNGTAPNRRNYLHVDDLCDAILFLSHHGISGEKYNIAAAEESDNLKLAQIISRLLGKKLNYELIEQEQNSLVLPRLSGEKLQKLGWQQKKTLEEGLKELVESLKDREIYDY